MPPSSPCRWFPQCGTPAAACIVAGPGGRAAPRCGRGQVDRRQARAWKADRAAVELPDAPSARNPSGGFLRLRTEVADQQPELVLQLAARDDHVDHPVLEQIFGALEPFGELLANGLLDNP